MLFKKQHNNKILEYMQIYFYKVFKNYHETINQISKKLKVRLL